MNSSTFVGNLARDPELRFTPSGQAVCNFGLAVNRRFQRNGQWEEQVSFFDVTVWGTLGENVAGCLTKGTRVIVHGRMEQQSWEEQDGTKRSKVIVTAEAVGPELRWAMADITKNERREGNSGTPQQSNQPAASGYDDGPGF